MGFLYTASDLQLHIDLGKQLKFAQHIIATSLQPDMIIASEVTKQLIMFNHAYSALGRSYRRSQGEETCKVSGTGGEAPGQSLEDAL